MINVKTSQLTSRNLRNSATDLRISNKTTQMDRNVSRLEAPSLIMASHLSVEKYMDPSWL